MGIFLVKIFTSFFFVCGIDKLLIVIVSQIFGTNPVVRLSTLDFGTKYTPIPAFSKLLARSQ